jgi:histidinol dehydrogenase
MRNHDFQKSDNKGIKLIYKRFIRVQVQKGSNRKQKYSLEIKPYVNYNNERKLVYRGMKGIEISGRDAIFQYKNRKIEFETEKSKIREFKISDSKSRRLDSIFSSMIEYSENNMESYNSKTNENKKGRDFPDF